MPCVYLEVSPVVSIEAYSQVSFDLLSVEMQMPHSFSYFIYYSSQLTINYFEFEAPDFNILKDIIVGFYDTEVKI